MMAAESNLKNMVLCLFVVCLVCSAILAVVYAGTKAPIEKTNAANTAKAISLVVPEFDSTPVLASAQYDGKDYPYYTVSKGGQVIGYAIQSTTIGFGGPLTLMVGITMDGKIYNTSVLQHSETPGLGAKCTSDQKFINQFKGFDPASKQLAVSKDGGDVDAITASTITSRAYTLAIKNAVEDFKKIGR